MPRLKVKVFEERTWTVNIWQCMVWHAFIGTHCVFHKYRSNAECPTCLCREAPEIRTVKSTPCVSKKNKTFHRKALPATFHTSTNLFDTCALSPTWFMLPTGWSFWLCSSCRLPHIFCRLNDWLAGCWDTSKLTAYTEHDLYIRIPDIPMSGDVNGSWARQWKNWRHRYPSLPNAMQYSFNFSQYL